MKATAFCLTKKWLPVAAHKHAVAPCLEGLDESYSPMVGLVCALDEEVQGIQDSE